MATPSRICRSRDTFCTHAMTFADPLPVAARDSIHMMPLSF